MVCRWVFRNGSHEVAIETGFIYSMQGRHMLLSNVKPAKR